MRKIIYYLVIQCSFVYSLMADQVCFDKAIRALDANDKIGFVRSAKCAIDFEDENGTDLLDEVVEQNKCDLITDLINIGYRLDRVNEHGRTDVRTRIGKWDCLSKIIELSTESNNGIFWYTTKNIYSTDDKNYNFDLVQYSIERGIPFDIFKELFFSKVRYRGNKNELRDYAKHAIATDRSDILGFLLENGLKLNEKMYVGVPMMDFARTAGAKKVSLLLKTYIEKNEED